MPDFLRITLIAYAALAGLALCGVIALALFSGEHPSSIQTQLAGILGEVIRGAVFTLGGLLAGFGISGRGRAR